MENVTFGSQDVGPVAIDGIQVHRLNVKIIFPLNSMTPKGIIFYFSCGTV